MNQRDQETKVLVRSLPRDASVDDVKEAFKGSGLIVSTCVTRKPTTSAFLHYDDWRDAQDAATDLNGW